MTCRDAVLSGVALTALLVGTAVAPVGATQTGRSAEPSLTVALGGDGDARVTLTSTFDLADESERTAFEALRANETVRGAYADRQLARWRTLANDTATRTDREMTVTNGTLALSRTNATGYATFSVVWTGLAAVTDGTLTLDEPFASGYTPDRRLVVQLPEGYQLTSVSPGPANITDRRLVYEPGTSLDGLSVVAVSPATTGTGIPLDSPSDRVGTATGSGPGFGVAGALASLLAVALLVRRRG